MERRTATAGTFRWFPPLLLRDPSSTRPEAVRQPRSELMVAMARVARVGVVGWGMRTGEVGEGTPQLADLLGWVQVSGQYLHS
jgi:hypothetical protein